MRIIAGEFRGRRLLPPETEVTRPITDRVKQSLFDILSPMMEGANVYDCFCGTGSMGLECLSRGARQATFFDADRSAIERLRKNIDALNVRDRSIIMAGDIFKWAAKNKPERDGGGTGVDLVFLDPPYRFVNDNASELQGLADALAMRHLASGGTLVFRHDAADALNLPGLAVYDVRSYGGMTLEFLRPANRAGT